MSLQLGDKVKVAKLDDDVQGVVVGIVNSDVFIGNNNLIDFKRWNKWFGNWHKKPVVYVRLDQPHKSMSFEEFEEYYNETHEKPLSQFDLNTEYEKSVPLVQLIVCPVDGVNLQ